MDYGVYSRHSACLRTISARCQIQSTPEVSFPLIFSRLETQKEASVDKTWTKVLVYHKSRPFLIAKVILFSETPMKIPKNDHATNSHTTNREICHPYYLSCFGLARS